MAPSPRSSSATYTPLPWLDSILTLGFLLLLVQLARSLWNSGDAAAFAGGLVLCHLVVISLRAASASCARSLGRWVAARGAVAADPFAAGARGALAVKKWSDQAWQLAVHVAGSAAAAALLSVEPWWERPDTAWTLDARGGGFVGGAASEAALRGIYLAQLVVWVYTCAAHRFVDERRRDYFVLYTHHLATIAL